MNERASTISLLKALTPMGGGGGPARRWPGLLLLIITLATLWAGLDPKGYRFRNEVVWLDGRPGLRFGKFGRVHTAPLLDAATAADLSQAGFTLTLAIDPAPDPQGAFRVIACFHAEDSASQFIIGQWREFVIVMNGDDYDNTRRLPRVTTDTSLFADRPLMLAIVTTINGTSLYLNGERVAANARLQLTLPAKPAMGRLVLGNSVNASQPWKGEITSFELLARPLTTKEVQARYRSWRAGETQTPDLSVPALLAFNFSETRGNTIQNLGSLAEPLAIPPRLYALGARALAWDPPLGASPQSLQLDIVLNFVGFLPIGFAFALALRTTRTAPWGAILLTTLAGISLSLVIELAQAWIPSRDSSLRDLLLNTAGAPIGAFFAVRVRNRFAF